MSKVKGQFFSPAEVASLPPLKKERYKLNPEQMLQEVKNAIANRPDSAAKKFAVYEMDGKISCEPVIANPPDSTLIGIFTIGDLNQGFTNKQWSKIMHKCAGILKKG